MKVLSLFDGISCGRVALERVGIPIEEYYASEIDKYTIQISKKNWPDIIQLGDITNWKNWELPKIDLIIAGSPCQGFSFAGKQLNFEDSRSSLFFEFVNILKHYKPKYFILENVKMKKEYQDVISSYLGVPHILINSSLVSAQNRQRLYWTNIPNVTQPEDKGILLKDIILNGNPICWSSSGRGNGRVEKRLSSPDKAHTLTATGYSNRSFSGVDCLNGAVRKLLPIECERLQNLPDNFTEGVSDSQRYKMLGNGWTVDVITHILKGLKDE